MIHVSLLHVSLLHVLLLHALIIHVIITHRMIYDIKNIIFENIFDNFSETKQIYAIVDNKWFQIVRVFGSVIMKRFKIRSSNINKLTCGNLTRFIIIYLRHNCVCVH